MGEVGKDKKQSCRFWYVYVPSACTEADSESCSTHSALTCQNRSEQKLPLVSLLRAAPCNEGSSVIYLPCISH